MFDRIASVLTAVLMGAVLVMFETGQIAPRDAFFIGFAVVIIFTGQLVIARQDMGLVAALRSIVMQPVSYRSRTTLVSYALCLVLGFVLTAQVISGA